LDFIRILKNDDKVVANLSDLPRYSEINGFNMSIKLGYRGIFICLIMINSLWAQYEGIENYHQANAAFENAQYQKALVQYRLALQQSPELGNRFPKIHLKMALCLYKSGAYEQAADLFEQQLASQPEMADYITYFAALSHLKNNRKETSIKMLSSFALKYPESSLTIAVDSVLADINYQSAEWQKAERIYRKLLKYEGFDKGELIGRLMIIAKYLKRSDAVQNYAFTLLRKYPFHPWSKVAYNELKSLATSRLLTDRELERLFDYLTKTSNFADAEKLLTIQENLGKTQELLQWLKIELLYEKEQYWASLQAAKKQRAKISAAKYLRNIDLNIARCYLRMGVKDKAIEAYTAFQRRYPNDVLAAEVLWVVAWMHEELGNMSLARETYLKILNHYPRYELAAEARFRLGLSYYREGDWNAARNAWQKAFYRNKDDDWQDRLKYWIAKSYYAEKKDSIAQALLSEIVAQPFENYYTMKAYLLTQKPEKIRADIDTILTDIQHRPVSYLAKYLEHFQRPLLIQEIFGENYAQKELNRLAMRLKQPGWELTYALGEMNEKLQNYGKAYRYYRRVYINYFVDYDWKDWKFLIRHLYPLYFNKEVTTYAQKWNLAPASIWAVMKKESAFEANITSYANAYGLMQLIPPTAKRLSDALGLDVSDVRNLFNPDMNIHLGSYYLAELLKRYDGNMYQALAAYNAGEHRVDKWCEIYSTNDDDYFMENIEFEQTRNYVRNVMKYYWLYYLLMNPSITENDLAEFPYKTARNPWMEHNSERYE
jgi:soluble lytic murein transglycosylase